MNRNRVDIVVIGSGLSGLTASLCLRMTGFSVANLSGSAGRKPLRIDGRTTALLSDSVSFLERLGLVDSLESDGFGLISSVRLIDATGRVFRAPMLRMKADEIGLEAFGLNISNARLSAALRDRAEAEGVNFVEGFVSEIRESNESIISVPESGEEWSSSLLVGADGKDSAVRRLCGIESRRWNYPQTALAGNFRHEVDHGGSCVEFHTVSGPFTVVPLGERLSSLVWVESPDKASFWLGESREALELEIERRMDSILGKIELEGDLQSWPLSGMLADRYGKGRAVLVGDSGHSLPPIGAQGFNLGIRDVEELEGIALESGLEEGIGDLFHRRRAGDVAMRSLTADLLNRSLLGSLPFSQTARAFGFAFLSFGPLRRALMREGIAPGKSLGNKTLSH